MSLGKDSHILLNGGIGCLWFLLWAIYIKRNPASDPRISAKERAYIESSLAGKNLREDTKIPWKLLLTSKAVWAQTIVTIVDAYFSFTYMTQIPAYLKDILNYNLGTSGFLAAIPFLLFIILTPVTSIVSDFLRSRKILSTKTIRHSSRVPLRTIKPASVGATTPGIVAIVLENPITTDA
uniref:Uncharacterized protein n=1 Tax=Lutzomyia longipalpis TaxID=7200 RepID=A0A1B0ESR3_LUTLO